MSRPRFIDLDELAEELAVTRAQAYALVRSGALPAIKLGGRGQWRIERDRLEQFIQQAYTDTAQFIRDHPWPGERSSEEQEPEPEQD